MSRVPGVYRIGDDGALQLVHEYLDDGYELAEIRALLDIGRLEDDDRVLRLARRELRLLKVTADAQSFDHAPEFITMCLDIAAMDVGVDQASVRLVSVA